VELASAKILLTYGFALLWLLLTIMKACSILCAEKHLLVLCECNNFNLPICKVVNTVLLQKCDVLILGAGIVGLATGVALLESKPGLKVLIVEKERFIASHASGRNSGVLHAGFYYSPESLKAKFCKDGNFEIRRLAKKYTIPVRDVGKVVVTQTAEDNQLLGTLFERGIKNGVELEILDREKLKSFEPLATTHDRFIWSPTTAISDPSAITIAVMEEFLSLGGQIKFNTKVSLKKNGNEIIDGENRFRFTHVINASGVQADRISRSIGVGNEYAMLPFMGIYNATEDKSLPLQRLVYPVPHPINPFLGVHFTVTIDKKVKIGPTAIPIFGREQYTLTEGWSLPDIAQSLKAISSLIQGDSHKLAKIIKSEWPKIIQKKLIKEAALLVPTAFAVTDWNRRPPGIRAQLVHLHSGQLVQDFVVKSEGNSTHILNAVSPGWTSALPFGRWISQQVIRRIT
jgi:L-2-hydroxyglutarate oxidase LhgO